MNKRFLFLIIVASAFIFLTILFYIRTRPVSYSENYDYGNRSGEKDLDVVIEKPVIYLDGYEGKSAKVTVDFDGHFTMTYPRAEINGRKAVWQIEDSDNGRLSVNGAEYRYLFWEGETSYDFSFNKGFCVRGDEILTFLDKRLSEFRFTDQEKEDFITYWGPRMMNNPFNVISFQSKAYTEKAGLVVSPEPDVTLRVYMAWYPSDTYVNMTEQHFTVPSRSGKVVVEWGGSECKNPNSPDTVPSGNNLSSLNAAANQYSSASLQIPADPYAQYGAYAKCAKDWDQTGARKSGRTWAQLDSGTQQAAYNHWITHGTNGW